MEKYPVRLGGWRSRKNLVTQMKRYPTSPTPTHLIINDPSLNIAKLPEFESEFSFAQLAENSF